MTMFRGHTGSGSALGCAGLALLLGGCGSTGVSESTEKADDAVYELRSEQQRVVPDAAEAVVAAGSEQEFAWGFLRELAPDSNVVFSPHSLSAAFAMVTGAAEGTTLTEIEQVLRFGPADEAFHRSQAALNLALSSRNRLAMKTSESEVDAQVLRESNDIWIRDDAPPQPSYLDTLARFYGVGVHLADFGTRPEQARLAINTKVSDDTRELIPELIPKKRIGPLTVAVLTNAMYFKAPWVAPFATPGKSPFNYLDGSTQAVDMLATGGHLGYYAGEGFVAVALPYYGDELEMLLVVPDAGAYENVRAELSSRVLSEIVTGRTFPKLSVTFPKFNVKSTVPAKDVLGALGISAALNPGAEFPGFWTAEFGGVFIQDVFHQATVAVDELGTEASAATAVVLGLTSGAPTPEEVIPVLVDRPFLFAIRDNPTGAVLFAGQVVSP